MGAANPSSNPNPNPNQGGETALMGAAENGRLECLDHLIAVHIERKANLNAQVPTCWLGL